ncbi:MAG: NAD-dependent succinate-semialdehyde dehydrogenase [Prevotella sp.]|jgi:succinate-semialdehyde dehydrogenase/glutarate-semialdehyde dehydrogenase|nr:NAD-dependent succinate-semialdehyde dehydrogenase [Prevotella sp.]MCI1473996.1 NAD-dependent succinate-semialdehyde dehydrogenase [Prevotella sp.]
MEQNKQHSPIKTLNPFTNKIEKEFDVISDTEINEKIQNADTAFKSWRKTDFGYRAGIIHRVASLMRGRKEQLGRLATTEMGKLLRESIYEVELCADIFDYYADHAAEFLADKKLPTEKGEAFISYEPIGVLLSIQPWNFPFYQITRSAAPNLMAGNTMVLKHASNVPQCAQIMEDLFREAGLPDGVYQNLFIPGHDIDKLVANPLIRGVSLTGSEPAGASIASEAGKYVKKSILELGGSDHFIIMEDADIEKAVETAVYGRMWNAGQVCISPKRIIVPESKYQSILDKMKTLLAKLKLGDPMDPQTDIAPLSSEEAAQEVIRQIKRAIRQGAKLEFGGGRPDMEGAFVNPVILTHVEPGMDAYSDEIFGPVLVVYAYKNIDDAIQLANATNFGLGGTVFGTDLQRAKAVAREIDTGMVYINHVTGIAPELPFGGTKNSGIGREQSPAGIYEFVNPKLIRVTSPENPY